MNKLALLKHIYGQCGWEPATLDRVYLLMDLVAAEEREACADKCDSESTDIGIAQKCAALIRARSEKCFTTSSTI